MTKLLTFALCLVLALCALSFVACDDGDTPPTTDVTTTTYKMYSLTNVFNNGEPDVFERGDQMGENGPILSEDYMTFGLKSDGTCVSSSINMMTGATEVVNGTYTVDGESISITAEGTTFTGTLVGDTLTIIMTQEIPQQGTLTSTLVFKKA